MTLPTSLRAPQRTTPSATRRPRRWCRVLPAAAAASLLLVACGSGDGGAKKPGAADDPSAQLLVWTDSTRQPGFEQFKKSHPNVPMKIETYDTETLLTKIQLFNRTGKGWPDVLFSQVPNDVAALSSKQYDFAEPLDALIPADVRTGFGKSNADCTIDGKLYCLKNDLSQSVLWYDKSLMDQFGYQVPTTWNEYRDLGLRVAREHPGYIVGTAGFKFLYYDFFWSSGCPLQQVTGPDQVVIDTKDPRCTRVADLLDPLIAAGSVSRSGPFDTDVIKLGQEKKILMMPGASWYGDFVFKPDNSFKSAKGTIAAAAYPTWEGESTNWSGSTGGGIYMVSKHTKNTKGAYDMAQWMATSNEYQSTAATYPAYGPAAQVWSSRVNADGFYASDPFPVLQKAADRVNPIEANTRYAIEAPMTATVVEKVRGGGKIADGLSELDKQLTQLAQMSGYTVK
ncbi:extracellular solute-binding protein [Embleya sp. NBC_00888]|uniref:ABC transporter substrate-binding protein n=1 Tax=Embleya sp. NBC_00888 TaxID=2975960 RepID=UPI00386EAC3A|nr:extracellular solute-binding protein [Embleya sp. NBC_00888]